MKKLRAKPVPKHIWLKEGGRLVLKGIQSLWGLQHYPGEAPEPKMPRNNKLELFNRLPEELKELLQKEVAIKWKESIKRL